MTQCFYRMCVSVYVGQIAGIDDNFCVGKCVIYYNFCLILC